MISEESAMSAGDFDPELDDGATEEVDRYASRPSPTPIEPANVVNAPVGGRASRLSDAGRREFIILRREGVPAVRIALTHAQVFKALWRLWTAKRIAAETDAGVTVAEVKADLGAGFATSSIAAALRSLTRNGAVRAVGERVGSSIRNRFYPLNSAIEAFALAEVIGDNAFVQVGRTSRTWKVRAESEPNNLFDHAVMLRGWIDPVEPAESA